MARTHEVATGKGPSGGLTSSLYAERDEKPGSSHGQANKRRKAIDALLPREVNEEALTPVATELMPRKPGRENLYATGAEGARIDESDLPAVMRKPVRKY